MAFKFVRDPVEKERMRQERIADELKDEQLKQELREIVKACLDEKMFYGLNEKERSLVRSCEQRINSLGLLQINLFFKPN